MGGRIKEQKKIKLIVLRKKERKKPSIQLMEDRRRKEDLALLRYFHGIVENNN